MLMMLRAMLVILSLGYLSLFVSATVNPQLIVRTKNGTVKGMFGKMQDSRKFLGIPYGKAPVKDLRWKPSVPASSWNDILDATKPPRPCPQSLHGLYTNEDCLFLNIYAPNVHRLSTKVPVIFWIHGGSFLYGDGYGQGHLDAEDFVSSFNVIVVTVNYRLGALGWLVAEKLTGNYGLDDQLLALQWVRSNIDAFGGDINYLSIAGHDSGAFCVLAHLASPKSTGLFSSAMVFGMPLGVPLKSLGQAQNIGQAFLQNIGCVDLECAGKTSASTIAQKQQHKNPTNTKVADIYSFALVIDDNWLTDHPLKLIEAGKFNKVPILIGLNQDETDLLKGSQDPLKDIVPHEPKHYSKRGYVREIRNKFSKNAFEVLDMYPATEDANANYGSYHKLATSMIFSCHNLKMADAFVKANVTAYFHELLHVPDYIPIGMCPEGKTCHGSEVSYLFKALPKLKSMRMPNETSPAEVTAEQYIDLVNGLYPNTAPAILSCYPASNEAETNAMRLAKLQLLSQNEVCPAETSTPTCNIAAMCSHLKDERVNAPEFSRKEKSIMDFYSRKLVGFAYGDINRFDFHRGIRVEPWKSLQNGRSFMRVEYMPSGGLNFHYEECEFWNILGYDF